MKVRKEGCENMDMGEKIKYLRLQYNLTLEELGDLVGVGKSTVRKWETGDIANMRRDNIVNVAKALNTTPEYLMGWKKKISRKIPILGTVVAGIPITAQQEVLGYEEITSEMAQKGEHFALKVKGSSMEPTILAGDIVIIQQQSDVESGDISVVLIGNENATLKKVSKSNSGITLTALNVIVYEPHFYSWENIEKLPITIIGKVVELRRSF